jgi:hypothetical protein
MPKPRSAQISLQATPYYHCNSRCARRAFLCGRDLNTGIDYEYRRERIEQRILQLAYFFNPIRAQMAETPETSDHTSAKQRIKQAKQTEKTRDTPNQPKALYPFVGNPREPMPEGLPFKLEDYLELLDLWKPSMVSTASRQPWAAQMCS